MNEFIGFNESTEITYDKELLKRYIEITRPRIHQSFMEAHNARIALQRALGQFDESVGIKFSKLWMCRKLAHCTVYDYKELEARTKEEVFSIYAALFLRKRKLVYDIQMIVRNGTR